MRYPFWQMLSEGLQKILQFPARMLAKDWPLSGGVS